ncbi:MAG: succinate dehydrogenase [Actinomycetota bacterium]|nr:succinate dehydrogenase [Actinomycetota bacterium]
MSPVDTVTRRKRSFETWSWFFMRLSGLALVLLALIHFTITHIANDVVTTNHAFVAERWDNPLWRLFDWSLLALALAHGLTGLRRIIDDYVHRPTTRRITVVVLFGVSGALFAWGTFTIVSF